MAARPPERGRGAPARAPRSAASSSTTIDRTIVREPWDIVGIKAWMETRISAPGDGMLGEVLSGLDQAEVDTPLGLSSETDRAALSPLYTKILEAVEVAETLVRDREADLQRRVEQIVVMEAGR